MLARVSIPVNMWNVSTTIFDQAIDKMMEIKNTLCIVLAFMLPTKNRGSQVGKRKFSQYMPLMMAIKRDGVKNAGSVASLFLEIFTNGERQVRAPEVYALGICDEKKKDFRLWRQSLCDKGWLVFKLEQHRLSSVRYEPGHRLKPYITKEKTLRFEVATTEELYQSELRADAKFVSIEKHEKLAAKLEEQAKKTAALEAAMDRVINILDPDTNPKKREAYQAGKYDHKLEALLLHSIH